MNPNDLPPAARLAVLIEAGRAAYPNVTYNGRTYYNSTVKCGCAMVYAALGAGMPASEGIGLRELLHFADEHGISDDLFAAVEAEAWDHASLDEICHSLREGELATVAA